VTTHPARTSPQPAAPHPAHWLGYAALSGWLAGPLLAAGYWMASGDADDGQVSFGPTSYLLTFAGLLVVWAAFVWMTHSTLGTGWRIAAGRATTVFGFGSTGWLLVHFLRLPSGASINELALEWGALTLPYPAVAAIVQWRATRPVVAADVVAVVAGSPAGTGDVVLVPAAVSPPWIRRYRSHAIGAACLAVIAGGLAIESVGNGQARAADIPVRAANAEAEAPDAMLLLVKAPSRYLPSSYSYVDGVATISYVGRHTPSPAVDDLEVVVSPATSSPCSIDWAAADFSAGSGDQLSCAQTASGRWVATDDSGNYLFIGEHGGYDVALAVNSASDDPISPTALPQLFTTLHAADTSQRAVLNAEEDAQF
jgi:hypothetical protein